MKSAQDYPDRRFTVTRNFKRGNNDVFQAKITIIPARTECGSPGAIIMIDDLTEKAIHDTWLANVITTRESTVHLGRCLADMIDNLCDLLYLHQPKFSARRFENINYVPEELIEMAQSFSNNQVLTEVLNFSVSTLRLLMFQLNKSVAARETDNVLMIASLIETIGMKLKFNRLEQACLALETEANTESWQQIELCVAIIKKEIESLQIASEAVLHKKEPEYATS